MSFSKHLAESTRSFLLASLVFLTLTVSVAAQQNEVRTAIPVADSNRKLGVGDQVTYQVMEDKDPAVRLRVTDAGELDIPYLGRVKVASQTVASSRAMIKQLLEEKYYHQATVKLAIDTIARNVESIDTGTVRVNGKVNSPGLQNIIPGKVETLGDIITAAGGFSEFADSRKVKIIRQATDGETSKTEIVDMKAVLERGQIEKDVIVQDGDIIIVPQRLLNW